MKVEIDLNDILTDGDGGSESLSESIRRQIVESVSATIRESVEKQIAAETSRVVNEEMRSALAAQMPALVESLISAEYTPVSGWGNRAAAPTTFRAELVKNVCAQMVYKKAPYDSDKTAFTRVVDGVVDTHLAAFKAAFVKEVDGKFIAEAMAFATKKLSERVGIKT